MANILEKANEFITAADYISAIALLSSHLESNKNDYLALCLRSVAYRKNGENDVAIEGFKKALVIAPGDANIYSELGVTYFHAKRNLDALEMMNKATELEPENPYRYSSRAFIKDACKDVDGAIEDYERAIKLDPDDAIAYNNLGLLEEKKGRLEAAKKHYKKSDNLNGIDWDEFKQKLKSFEGAENETLAGEEEAKSAVQKAEQDKIRREKEDENKPQASSYWEVIKNIFTSKGELKSFIKFIGNGFKQ